MTPFPSMSWMSTVVRSFLLSKYGSSGIPTQIVTVPLPGNEACSTTGVVRNVTGCRLTTSDALTMLAP
jgi:hypothetical protein